MVKVLVAGDVKGNLDAAYARVRTLGASKAGPFDALFCVGQFFGSSPRDAKDIDDYMAGNTVLASK